MTGCRTSRHPSRLNAGGAGHGSSAAQSTSPEQPTTPNHRVNEISRWRREVIRLASGGVGLSTKMRLATRVCEDRSEQPSPCARAIGLGWTNRKCGMFDQPGLGEKPVIITPLHRDPALEERLAAGYGHRNLPRDRVGSPRSPEIDSDCGDREECGGLWPGERPEIDGDDRIPTKDRAQALAGRLVPCDRVVGENDGIPCDRVAEHRGGSVQGTRLLIGPRRRRAPAQ